MSREPWCAAREVEGVRHLYDFFDARRERAEPFDEGDAQTVHAWMRAVTEALERAANSQPQATDAPISTGKGLPGET